MNTLAPSFLNHSSSILQVTRTCMKAWMSSNLCPCASEKLMYNVVNTLAPLFFDWIFFILAGNEDIYNISDKFKIWPERTKDCGVSCP